MKTSNLYSLDLKDLAKGFIVAVGSAVIATIQTSLQAGSLDLTGNLSAQLRWVQAQLISVKTSLRRQPLKPR